MIEWHKLLEMALTDLFPRTNYTVEIEKELEIPQEFFENKFPFLKNVHRGFCTVETQHATSLRAKRLYVQDKWGTYFSSIP